MELLVERAADNLNLYFVFATDEAGGVEAEVVAEVHDIIVRVSDGSDGHE